MMQVEIASLDIYDPIKDEVKSRDVHDIVYWMVDDEAFARIYGHQSHPFPEKKGQKVAVRVISQFGEETTKVLEVK